jgi:hypothetical protein
MLIFSSFSSGPATTFGLYSFANSCSRGIHWTLPTGWAAVPLRAMVVLVGLVV